jgi:hypothetical protein
MLTLEDAELHVTLRKPLKRGGAEDLEIAVIARDRA